MTTISVTLYNISNTPGSYFVSLTVIPTPKLPLFWFLSPYPNSGNSRILCQRNPPTFVLLCIVSSPKFMSVKFSPTVLCISIWVQFPLTPIPALRTHHCLLAQCRCSCIFLSFRLRLLWIKLQQASIYKTRCGHMFSFLLDKYQGVELLDHKESNI